MSEHKTSQVTQAQVARDFDNVATSYEDQINSALAFAGREHAFYIDIKREHILRLARKHFRDLGGLDVLDLGCGLGAYHSGLEGKFRELHGVDVSARSIELAAAQHPSVHYSTFDGGRLPYRDGQFSIVFTVCVTLVEFERRLSVPDDPRPRFPPGHGSWRVRSRKVPARRGGLEWGTRASTT